jgi:excisionase family DNA binding protein
VTSQPDAIGGSAIKLRVQSAEDPEKFTEILIGDPLAWRRDHPEAYRQALEETDARIAEVVNGWGLSPPVVAGGGPTVVEVPPGETGRTRKAHPPSEDRLTMTVEEAAKVLGISRAFGYEAVNTGDIPTIRIGRRILVPKAALHRLVAGEPPTLGGSAPA